MQVAINFPRVLVQISMHGFLCVVCVCVYLCVCARVCEVAACLFVVTKTRARARSQPITPRRSPVELKLLTAYATFAAL